MPRSLTYDLADCLQRANPYVETVIEISEPDVSNIHRRPDQFTTTPPLVAGSMAPANSIIGSLNGGAQIVPTEAVLATFAGEQTFFNIDRENPERRRKGVSWEVDPAFVRGKLRSVKIRVERLPLPPGPGGGTFPWNVDFELQIFRVVKTPGVKQKFVGGAQGYQTTAFTQYEFFPQLSIPAVVKAAQITWGAGNKADVEFDLRPYALALENLAPNATAPDQTGDLAKYYFVVTGIGLPSANGYFRWLVDNLTARTVASVGTFKKVFWSKDNAEDEWKETSYGECPTITLKIDNYVAAAQADYTIDLGKAPNAAGTGRVVFERILPPGTAANVLLSTDGGGVYNAVKHGDVVGTVQQTYRLRMVLNADAAGRSSPIVTALGIEFRIPTDVMIEAIPALPTREISPPWLTAAIAESPLRVVRTGIRDFLDVATRLGSTQPATRLEADIFIASKHPAVTRDKWLRLERLMVSNRDPDGTGESFTLLSYLSKLKKKIPQKEESIFSVHTVTAATIDYVQVTPVLPGAVDSTSYDAKKYYMRVRTTAVVEFPPRYQQEIQGNTGTNQLDFLPALPAVLEVGAVIEVHSGIFNTTPLVFQDVDPAVAWDQVLNYAGVPVERIGLGYLPRGGKPPTVTDRAPGDAVTQAKLKVTLRVTEEEGADELLDQLSFIMGGATVEIDGQICFVQVYPLRALNGSVTVPLPPVAAAFDVRDYTGLRTPPGLERRATVCSAKYGVNSAAADPDAQESRATAVVDDDALQWLQRPDLDELAPSEVDEKISRWFYNSPSSGGDEGLYLASVVAQQVVRANSTGMRIFPFQLVEQHPELIPGDVIVLETENYTDYEPASATPISGPVAIKGVLVSVGGMGRQCVLYVTGLAENVTRLAGGVAGALTGLGAAPNIPTIGISFNANGTANIAASSSAQAVSHRIAYSSISQAIADADAVAGTIVQGNPAYAITSSVYAVGATVYVAAIAISSTGLESGIGRLSAIREGPALPYALVKPRDTRPWIPWEQDIITGRMGLPTLGYDTVPMYDLPGENELISPSAARIRSAMGGPVGVGFTTIESGGERGFNALDAAYILLAGSADFARAYTGKNLSNVPDDATSDRRAATANQKTGGDRGWAALDAGSILLAPYADFSRSYTGKNLSNVPDDATSDRRASTLNQKTGGDRGYNALDTAYKLATGVTAGATAADGKAGIESGFGARTKSSRAAGTATHMGGREEHLRAGIFGGLANPAGLFGMMPMYDHTGATPLFDPIFGGATSAFKAPDGKPNIESSFGAKTKSARTSGTSVHMGGREELLRGGMYGGLPNPGALVGLFPLYDATGADELVSTADKRIRAPMSGPTGVTSTVFERGGNKGDQALDSGYVLLAPSADFSRSYTGKSLANVPDDASSDRRAATANQKTGGDRGFSTIDVGLILVALALDLARAYTGKHLGNVPDDGTSDRRVVTLNEKTGAGRGYLGLASDGDLVGNIDGDTEIQAGHFYVESGKRVKVGTVATPATLTRRIRVPATTVIFDDGAFDWSVSGNGYVHPNAVGGATRRWFSFGVIPDGATIETFRARLYKQNSADTATAALYRADGSSATLLSQLTLAATGAWTELEDTAPSEVVDNSGGNVYFVFGNLRVASGITPPDARFMWCEVIYTIPDLGIGF